MMLKQDQAKYTAEHRSNEVSYAKKKWVTQWNKCENC